MAEDKNQKPDWITITSKAVTTIITGILIAWAGIVGNIVLSSIASKQESARLITELQIKREQAESVLRKDVFDKTLEAFFEKNKKNTGMLKDMSKQMLQLELLALNFGDSLSLSPLFAELRKDLDSAKPVNDEEKIDYNERKGELRKRLIALAKRVASSQLSSISQHGKIIQITIPLHEYKQIKAEDITCKRTLLENKEYAWPKHKTLSMFGFGDYMSIEKDSELYKEFNKALFDESRVVFDGVSRYLELHVKNVNHCRKTAEVQILLRKEEHSQPTEESASQSSHQNHNPGKIEVDREFNLDYFNFPMVDNTRLSNNHRFAIVMEEFELDRVDPRIEIVGIIFPSEYASLRDRPGMQEARRLLESALKNGDDNND